MRGSATRVPAGDYIRRLAWPQRSPAIVAGRQGEPWMTEWRTAAVSGCRRVSEGDSHFVRNCTLTGVYWSTRPLDAPPLTVWNRKFRQFAAKSGRDAQMTELGDHGF